MVAKSRRSRKRREKEYRAGAAHINQPLITPLLPLRCCWKCHSWEVPAATLGLSTPMLRKWPLKRQRPLLGMD